MLVLSVDTSGRQGSVALLRGDAGHFDVLEEVALSGGTYSAQLMPTIAALLDRHRLHKTDIEGFTVASGPGSFTGLRVGLSTVKALAEILQRPVAPVSVLEALAARVPDFPADTITRRINALLDAGRGEVYVAQFEGPLAQRRVVYEKLQKLDAWFQDFMDSEVKAYFVTSDTHIAEFISQNLTAIQPVASVTATDIARLGMPRLAAGQGVSALELDANYIRRSDAEIAFVSRRG